LIVYINIDLCRLYVRIRNDRQLCFAADARFLWSNSCSGSRLQSSSLLPACQVSHTFSFAR